MIIPKRKPNLTDTLCTRCGLCCDGSLFADVELASQDEASTLEIMGLEVEEAEEDGDGLLLQPCRALKGKRCSLYAHRPDCCRTFECRLLQQVKRGVVSVDQAQTKIAQALEEIERAQELIVRLEQSNERLPLKERCAAALDHSENFAADPKINRKRTKLKAAMDAVERLIQETFLGG